MTKKTVLITFLVWVVGGGAAWGFIDYLAAQEGNSLSEMVRDLWDNTWVVFLIGAVPSAIFFYIAGHLTWGQKVPCPECGYSPSKAQTDQSVRND